MHMLEFNITKRVFEEIKKGPCEITNPVDSYWRCDLDLEKNKKKLVDCALGFAHGTTCGKDGELYVIVDPIVDEIIVTSDKTIDVRGANMEIYNGVGITVQFAKNVIIHGLYIHHISLTKGGEVKDGKNYLGDSYAVDEKIEVTVALNHFGKGLVERMPRCQFGFIHVFNNDYIHLFLYAIGGTNHPTIISQGYRYLVPGTYAAKEVACKGLLALAQWKSWN
ncbi:hypothetical protein Goshw_004884 [Gossypium schwendimanii]|uniref:Pectate lyase domain-containing protein n=1 Tax=Gossypium schwendimanii TaxID=34291 RepID=A0A7J9M0T9_GOSSC|nr:hypothetical protein [Gossypium schwendimanii]